MPDRTLVDASPISRESQSPSVVYVHGIGNKPAPDVLKVEWDQALFGLDVGARTRMAYWADIRYPQPEVEIRGQAVLSTEGRLTAEQLVDEFRHVTDPEALEFIARLGSRILEEAPKGPVAQDVETLILPEWMRQPVVGFVTRLFLRDVAAYFYDQRQRESIRARLRQVLIPQKNPYVIVAHSLGSVIAYDVLRELEREKDVHVRLLVTIGSPLGLPEVQDKLGAERRTPRNVAEWRNFYDPWDPVSLRHGVQESFPAEADQPVKDEEVRNADSRLLSVFGPHSGAGYLRTEEVQDAVRGIVGASFAAPLNHFVVARDLAAAITDSTVRHDVLIEIREQIKGSDLTAKRNTLIAEMKVVIGETAAGGNREKSLDAAKIDPLRRYVAAKLTTQEIYRLSSRFEDLHIETIWRNAAKAALIEQSAKTVQAFTARVGYCATGRGIRWAVLDTGIVEEHPHFSKHQNVEEVWDCLEAGPIRRSAPGTACGVDRNGHGTHVAGIIAGCGDGAECELIGIAPETKLRIYKTLDDRGRGNDAWVIKALDHIASVNEEAPELAIHGVNLSLGGNFDATVFACGYSPICRELRRLWRMGVVVCIAAGNEGRLMLATARGEQPVNLDLSIGDPANLEEAIAVGSVHKSQPHMYGISYFSSRGPTADGRAKPDLVAPGEHIVSCNHEWHSKRYVPKSGTSMACPHVSGVIAGFLSVRREFIGHPDRVKDILLANCTDLGRDRYHQGAGMPNLVKMLMTT